VTLKASFSNDQNLVQAVKDKTNDFISKSLTQLSYRDFELIQLVNLTKGKGDNVKSRE